MRGKPAIAAGAVKRLLIMGVLLALLGEGVAHFWLYYLTDGDTFHRFASIRQIQQRNDTSIAFGIRLPYGLFPTPGYARGLNRHTSRGYRGEEFPREKPEGEFRIACLGGSTTYTEEVEDYRLAYPALLETYLREAGYNVRVLNAGCPGWTSREDVINYVFRVQHESPDLLVVYEGINDLLQRGIWPPEIYVSDYALGKGPFPDFMLPRFWDYSVLLRAFRVGLGFAEPPAALFGGSGPEVQGVNVMRFLIQHNQGTYPQGIFEGHSLADIFAANPPIYYAHNLRNLVLLAHAQGDPVVLATFAYDEETLFNFAGEAAREFTGGMAEMNTVMKTVAASTPALLFDFEAVMPFGHAYWGDFIHVNEEGSAKKAALFAEYLLDSGLIPAQYRTLPVNGSAPAPAR